MHNSWIDAHKAHLIIGEAQSSPLACCDGLLKPPQQLLVLQPTPSPPAPGRRWFEDTYAEAHRGDVKQAALLGQMLAEGYGCEKDPQAAQQWTDRARSRGYRMQGVYCEL